jgi:hypothetical protein
MCKSKKKTSLRFLDYNGFFDKLNSLLFFIQYIYIYIYIDIFVCVLFFLSTYFNIEINSSKLKFNKNMNKNFIHIIYFIYSCNMNRFNYLNKVLFKKYI